MASNLTAICNLNCKFRAFHCGTQGSRHDAHVWRKMPPQLWSSRKRVCFSEDGVILGDSAYHLSPSSMVPYKKTLVAQFTEEKRLFNLKLSEIRVKVEHTFGILKNRLPLLQNLPVTIDGDKGIAVRWV